MQMDAISKSKTLTEPTPLHIVSLTSPQHHGYNISCKGGHDGQIDLTVDGGVPPYKYDWSTGSFDEDISNLEAGEYSVRISDGNSAEIVTSIQLTQPSGSLKVTLTPQVYSNGFNLSCHDCANGSITCIGSAGTPPYALMWSNAQTNSTISGLQALEYTCTITDINGCTTSERATLHSPDRDDWSMAGNANTNSSSQFIGTTDNHDLVFKTNNIQRMSISSIGNIVVNQGITVDSLNVGSRLLLNGKYAIGHQTASGSYPEIFSFGKLPTNSTYSISSCTSPVLNTFPNYQFGGTIQLYGNSAFGGNLNVMDLGFDGANSIIDATGTSSDPNSNRLLINYYCGKDVFVGNELSGDLTANRNFFTHGKVGIGTTNINACSDCNDYNLFVTKGIRTEKVKVDIASTNGWADFVFDSSYIIMPMPELLQYLQLNKHLPDVPTENEVRRNGLDVAQTQKLLLQKIEELTLYVLQLNNENENLKSKMDEIMNDKSSANPHK